MSKGTYSKEQLKNMVQPEHVSRLKTKILKLRMQNKGNSMEIHIPNTPSVHSTPKHNQRNDNEISPKLERGKEPVLSPSFSGSTNNSFHENSEDRNPHRYCVSN